VGEDLAASIRRSPTCQVGNLDRLQNRLDRTTAAQPFQDRQRPPIDLELGLRGAQEPGDGRGMQPGRQRLNDSPTDRQPGGMRDVAAYDGKRTWSATRAAD
jgi:hypothetical protein